MMLILATFRRLTTTARMVRDGRWPRSCVNPSVLEKTGLVS